MAGHLCLRLISHISSVYSNHKMLLSSCDSRNLNLSPFCNLTSTSLAMWQPSVLETYGNLKTDYIEQISGPLRLKYPNSMADEELITALTKVKPCKGQCSNLPPQTIMKFCCYALLQPPYILFVIDLLFHREICTTMPTKRILPLWTSFLESQLCSVCSTFTIKRIDQLKTLFFRIWAVTKNDLVGLHFWLWRDLRTLPWNQFCVSGWDSLLVLH